MSVSLLIPKNGNDGADTNSYLFESAFRMFFFGEIRDVCGQIELTPMAIAAGRRLADRLFSPNKVEHECIKVSYELVPTVVFSHPVR